MQTSSDESRPSQLTEDVSPVATVARSATTDAPVRGSATTADSGLKLIRVQDVKELQHLMSVLSHNSWLQQYAMNHFRDPDTLILRYGRGCLIASIVKHDLMADTVVLVWAQNPDHFSSAEAWKILRGWGQSRGCNHVAAYIDMDSSVWKHMKAARRLTGMKPYKIVISTGGVG